MVGSEQPAAPRSYGSGGAETQRTSTPEEPEEPRAATRERRPRRALLGGALALTAAVAGLSSPSNYKLHYIYDGFAWSHCDDTHFRFKPTRW